MLPMKLVTASTSLSQGEIQELSLPSQELGAETSLLPFWVAGWMPGAGASEGKGGLWQGKVEGEVRDMGASGLQ